MILTSRGFKPHGSVESTESSARGGAGATAVRFKPHGSVESTERFEVWVITAPRHIGFKPHGSVESTERRRRRTRNRRERQTFQTPRLGREH